MNPTFGLLKGMDFPGVMFGKPLVPLKEKPPSGFGDSCWMVVPFQMARWTIPNQPGGFVSGDHSVHSNSDSLRHGSWLPKLWLSSREGFCLFLGVIPVLRFPCVPRGSGNLGSSWLAKPTPLAPQNWCEPFGVLTKVEAKRFQVERG